MEINKWWLWTLGSLFAAACVAHIIQTIRGPQQININVSDGHEVHINEPSSSFEIDTTIRAGSPEIEEEEPEDPIV